MKQQADELEDVTERMINELVALRQEILAKELIMGVLVNKLGGKVTLTKQDMKDLTFIVGDPLSVLKNGGFCLERQKNKDASVTFTLLVGPSSNDLKVM